MHEVRRRSSCATGPYTSIIHVGSMYETKEIKETLCILTIVSCQHDHFYYSRIVSRIYLYSGSSGRFPDQCI